MTTLDAKVIHPHNDSAGDHEWWLSGREVKAARNGRPNPRMIRADWLKVECNELDCPGWGIIRKDAVIRVFKALVQS